MDPQLEMRRLAGKVALLLAWVYALVLVGGVIGAVRGHGLAAYEWLLLSCPALAFVPAVTAAVKLHRTSEPQATRKLWRRSFALAVLGLALLAGTAVLVGLS